MDQIRYENVKAANIHQLNKAFESRVRLGIMSVLLVNDDLDFGSIKDHLQVTDGNLSSHANALEKEGYIHIHKSFVGKKPLTTYSVTKTGITAFQAHIDALESLLRMNK